MREKRSGSEAQGWKQAWPEILKPQASQADEIQSGGDAVQKHGKKIKKSIKVETTSSAGS